MQLGFLQGHPCVRQEGLGLQTAAGRRAAGGAWMCGQGRWSGSVGGDAARAMELGAVEGFGLTLEGGRGCSAPCSEWGQRVCDPLPALGAWGPSPAGWSPVELDVCDTGCLLFSAITGKSWLLILVSSSN